MNYVLWAVLATGTLVGFASGNSLIWLTPLIAWVLLPIFDYWTGTTKSAVINQPLPISFRSGLLIWGFSLFYLYGILYLQEQTELNPINRIGGIFAAGFSYGVIFYSIGHEFMHQARKSGGPFIAMLLLAPMGYSHHVVHHLLDHHFHASTSKDPATASYQQSFYEFLLQAISYSFHNAWRYEVFRLIKKNHPVLGPRNRMLQGLVLSAAHYGLIIALFGIQALGSVLGMALVVVLFIEGLNYVQHYGLRRHRDERGRYEDFTTHHAWDAEHVLTNQLLLAQGFHSAHHRDPDIPCHALKADETSLKLPFGYITMILFALIPPLWRYIMDPLAQRARRQIPLQRDGTSPPT